MAGRPLVAKRYPGKANIGKACCASDGGKDPVFLSKRSSCGIVRRIAVNCGQRYQSCSRLLSHPGRYRDLGGSSSCCSSGNATRNSPRFLRTLLHEGRMEAKDRILTACTGATNPSEFSFSRYLFATTTVVLGWSPEFC